MIPHWECSVVNFKCILCSVTSVLWNRKPVITVRQQVSGALVGAERKQYTYINIMGIKLIIIIIIIGKQARKNGVI